MSRVREAEVVNTRKTQLLFVVQQVRETWLIAFRTAVICDWRFEIYYFREISDFAVALGRPPCLGEYLIREIRGQVLPVV